MKRRKDYIKKRDIGQIDFITFHDNQFSARVICGHSGSGFGRKSGKSFNETSRERYGRVI